MSIFTLKSIRTKLSLLAAALVLSVGAAGQSEAAVFEVAKKWPADTDGYTRIPVCLEPGNSAKQKGTGWDKGLTHAKNPSLDSVVKHVRSALESSWERHSKIRFTGWGECPLEIDIFNGVRLRIAPDAKNIGDVGRPYPTTASSSLLYGGAFGWIKKDGKKTRVVNTITGAASCPSDYKDTLVYGKSNIDYPFNICTAEPGSTVKHLEFGGMYGTVKGKPSPNPLTGKQSCPPHYLSQKVLGYSGVDASLYICYEPANHGGPLMSFGGMIGSVDGERVDNPQNGETYCPQGYTTQQVLGKDSFDYNFSYCYANNAIGQRRAARVEFMPWGRDAQCITYDWSTTHVEYTYDCVEQYAIHEFGHVLGFGHEMSHPKAPSACKVGEPQIGTDYARTPRADVRYTVPNAGYDWNSIMAYNGDKKDCAKVTGVRFGSKNLSSGDIAGLMLAYPFPNPIANSGLLYGGAYGWIYPKGKKTPVVNPATGKQSCPKGYTDNLVSAYSGSYTKDLPLHICTADYSSNLLAKYDFGGMWSSMKGERGKNPITGDKSCPAGYDVQQVRGYKNYDYALNICYAERGYRKNPRRYAVPIAYLGGIISSVEGEPYTLFPEGLSDCPEHYKKRKVLGKEDKDYGFRYCYAKLN